MRGIPTIDCMLGLTVSGIRGRQLSPRQGLRTASMRQMADEGWIRDADTGSYAHPAQHLFKDAPERMGESGSIEDLLGRMDEVGIERALVDCDLDDPAPVLEVIGRYPDRFFANVNVNPFFGMPELRRLESVVKDYPLIRSCCVTGFRIQRPYNDKIYWPLYAKCCELDLPVVCYVGLPGPRVPGEVQHPMTLDEICWFFPELTIVMRHGGEPWEFECVKLMLKWPNLYYSTSAFAPKHYPKDILHYANTRGADRVIYAGYWPGLDLRRIAHEIENEVDLRDHVWPKFLRENAIKAFRLDAPA